MQYCVIPPEAGAAFAAHKEDMLETCERPYDPQHPAVCMDEQPVQLLKSIRVPLAAATERQGPTAR